MQCKNCFIIGHTAKHCKTGAKCNVCSSGMHEPLPCTKVQCINCKQQHRSHNKNCPTFLKRKDIITFKTLNKCSFREATESINNQNLQYNTLHEKLEAILKKKNKSIVQKTQTNTNDTLNPSTHLNSSRTLSNSKALPEAHLATHNDSLPTHSSKKSNSTTEPIDTAITNYSLEYSLPINYQPPSNIHSNILNEILNKQVYQYNNNDNAINTQITPIATQTTDHTSSVNSHSMKT